MKKFLILSALLVLSNLVSKAQITKKDFENVFQLVKYENIKNITYSCGFSAVGTGGSSSTYCKWNIRRNKEKESYELKENALYLISYFDESKSKIEELVIIPYEKVITIQFNEDKISIHLAQ